MKKSKVEGRILEVVTYDEYTKHPDLYQNNCTGVELDKDGKTYVLPHRSTSYQEDKPGVYKTGCINRFVFPNKEKENLYTQEIIDLSDVQNISELTKKMEKVRDIEREILTTPDNIYVPNITDEDSRIMRGLKEAVIAKNIDIDKYADRFGDNYPNDKRQLRKHDITLFMFERMCNKLDMSAKLIISDKNPNVANPIKGEIVVDLVSDDEDDI